MPWCATDWRIIIEFLYTLIIDNKQPIGSNSQLAAHDLWTQ